MKISIITPVYNDAKYLSNNIQSLKQQTHRDFEHIVVDGGSTDATLSLLEAHDHLRWISEPDDGMYSALNKGLRMGSGEVFGYVNADDRYFDDTLARVARCFERNPDVDFVYGNCTFIDNNETPITTFRALPFWSPLVRRGPIRWAQTAFFWHRRVHETSGMFDDSMRNTGDFEFFRRILNQGYRGKKLARPLAKFMVRTDAISFTLGENYWREIDEVMRRWPVKKRSLPYMANVLLYHLMNVDTNLTYAGFYIPYRHGSFVNFVKKKLLAA